MICWSTLLAFMQHELAFITWRDAIEIIFFAGSCYYFLRWLSHDKQKNLVFWFYSYCILTFGAHFAQLNSMSLVLFLASPLIIMLFIIMHQHTLQKNFIALKNITPEKKQSAYHWLEELMQASLHGVNKNREIICIIERSDSIDQFLSASCCFNANVNREILELLMSATVQHESITLWINHAGRLIAIDPTWTVHPDATWVSDNVKALHKWKQDSLFITDKTDAIIFTLSPTTRLFDLVIEGKTMNQMSAGQTFSLLKQYSNLSKTKDINHAHITSKNTFEQELS